MHLKKELFIWITLIVIIQLSSSAEVNHQQEQPQNYVSNSSHSSPIPTPTNGDDTTQNSIQMDISNGPAFIVHEQRQFHTHHHSKNPALDNPNHPQPSASFSDWFPQAPQPPQPPQSPQRPHYPQNVRVSFVPLGALLLSAFAG